MKHIPIILITLLLTACLPLQDLPDLPTETPAPTQTATPTVIWFPPTETPTPGPTLLPSETPVLRPEVGTLLYSDSFASSAGWTLLTTVNSNISVANNEITLALSQPKSSLFSVQEGYFFSDFYAEITTSPSLCSGVDEYGLLLRYNNPTNFYRFSLSCDGQLRLDRVISGTASSAQGWMRSAAVPSAAPSISRLGVWASGREMRFFVNDQYQFSISDPSLKNGALGVFIRSAGETAVTVSFSDLTVYQIEP
ncbi:MAG: hypothetical protein HN413_15845 [Chloroflexi bacterium]|jgi:hypothetical protein|nr:hypothetical protein [Chloroflexota bacterium]